MQLIRLLLITTRMHIHYVQLQGQFEVVCVSKTIIYCAYLHLVAHIRAAGRILTNQDCSQLRCPMTTGHPFLNLGAQLATNVFGDLLSID